MKKTIIITGGSDGLRKTLTEALAKENNVIIDTPKDVMIPEVGIKNINN